MLFGRQAEYLSHEKDGLRLDLGWLPGESRLGIAVKQTTGQNAHPGFPLEGNVLIQIDAQLAELPVGPEANR